MNSAGCRGYLLDGNIGLVTVCLPVLTKARGGWNSVLLKKVRSAKELAAGTLLHPPEASSPAHPLSMLAAPALRSLTKPLRCLN